MKKQIIVIAMFLTSIFELRVASAQNIFSVIPKTSDENNILQRLNVSKSIFRNDYLQPEAIAREGAASNSNFMNEIDSKNYAVVFYPLSLILTKLSADIQYALGNGNLILHFGKYLGGIKVFSQKFEGFEFEISHRFILAGPEARNINFEGLYLAPVIQYSFRKRSNTIYSFSFFGSSSEEEIFASTSELSLGFDTGYQIVWGNITLNLNSGLLLNLSPKELKGMSSDGKSYHVAEIETLEWRGVGIGIGILF